MGTRRHKKTQNARRIFFLALSCAFLRLIVFSSFAETLQAPTLQLAVELSGEGDHSGAAIEFRRLAVAAPAPREQGGYYWASSYEYFKSGQSGAADKMLDRAEDALPDLKVPALLLRGENALASKRLGEATFYYETVLDGPGSDEARGFAARRSATAYLRQGDVNAAREVLRKSPVKSDEGMAALDEYAVASDKSPKVGGLLGLVPGLGYFYSGEYANGLRSIILNGLFMFGMVDTADKEQWGAFAVITFFEFTWYSGSIYGGIDAAHRYNRNRLDSAVGAIHGDASFEPAYSQMPEVVLQFRF